MVYRARLLNAIVVLLGVVTRGLDAFSCFSEMQFDWCESQEEESCIHNYTFSVSHFQRKLDRHYRASGRPPLSEAFFLVRLPGEYQHNLVIDQDCPAPLILAYLLVAEFRLWTNQEAALQSFKIALELESQATPVQRELLPKLWPYQEAVNRFAEIADANAQLAASRPQPSIDFVVAHCLEPLTWLRSELKLVPPRASLFVYEKCGQRSNLGDLLGLFEYVETVDRPDVGSTRGDECSAYLTHLVTRFDSLADFTVFLQSDPHEHLHFDFLHVVLQAIAARTYDVPFLHLNGPRHVRTLTPCLQAVHQVVLGAPLTEPLGPYCCAQFVVARRQATIRGSDFFQRMLKMVDGSMPLDLCGVEGAQRSTQCYGYEFIWHIVFGQEVDPPLRADDSRLPLALRGKSGREHMRTEWAGVPLANDIPMKFVPESLP